MARQVSFRFDAIQQSAVASIVQVAEALGTVKVSSTEASAGLNTATASATRLQAEAKSLAVTVTQTAEAQVRASIEAKETLRTQIVAYRDIAAAAVKGSEEQVAANRLAADSAAQLAAAYKVAGDSALAASRKAVTGARDSAAAERGATGRTALRGRGVGGVTAGLVGVGPGLLAGAAATLGAISTLGVAGGFQQQLNILQQASGATTKQLAAARVEAKALGQDLTLPATSAKDAAEAMTELAKAGLSVNEAIAAGKGTLQLAAAANLAAADAAKIEASVLNAFEIGGGQATKVADQLAAAANAAQGEISDMAYGLAQSATVAHQFGLTTGETVTALTELAKAGLRGSDAGTSLRTMLQRLVPNTKKARDLLHELGIEVADSHGQFFSITKIIGNYHDALSKLNPQAKQQALYTLFGADAQRAANVVLGKGAKTFTDLRKEVEKQGAAAQTAAARNKGYLGALDAFKSAVETLQISIGEKLLPTFTEAFKAAGRWVNRMESSGKAADAAKQGLDVLVAAFKVARVVVVNAATAVGALIDIVGGLKNALILLAGVWAVSKVYAFGKALLLVRANLIATGRASKVAAGEYEASMGAMKLATIGLSATIKAALISTGIGALIVAVAFAAEYTITHWEKVKGWVKQFGQYLKVTFNVAWAAVRESAKAAVYLILQYATAVFRGILELASHLPFVGDKARAALNSINDYIERWKPEFGKVAAEAGAYAGSQLGKAFANATKDAVTRAGYAATAQSGGQAAAESPGRAGARRGASGGTGGTGFGVVSPVPTGAQQGIIGTPGVGTHNQADWQSRNAIDIKVAPHTPILAVENGVVVKVSINPPGITTTTTGKRLAGSSITLRGASNTYFYTHLERVTVKAGQRVKRGQVIGYSGALDHLHFAVEKGSPVPFEDAPTVSPAKGTTTSSDISADVPGTADLPTTTAKKKKSKKDTAKEKAAARAETKAAVDTLRATVNEMQKALSAAFTIRPVDAVQTEGQLRRHVDAIRRQLAQVAKAIRGATTDADVKVLQARLDKLRDGYTKTLDNIKALIEAKRGALTDAMGKTADFMLRAFDRVVATRLAKLNATFDAQVAAITAAGAALTPAEAQLASLDRQAQDRDIAAKEKALRDARRAHADKATIARLQEDFDRARLEQQAQGERETRDKQTAEALDAIEKQRTAAVQAAQDAADAQRQAFEAGLTALDNSLAAGRISWEAYSRDIRKLMAKYGLDPDWWTTKGQQAGAALGEGLTGPFLAAWRAAIAEVKADLAGLERAAAPTAPGKKKKQAKGGRSLQSTTTVDEGNMVVGYGTPPPAGNAPYATKTVVQVTLPNAVFLTGDRRAARELAKMLEPELERRVVGFNSDV